MPTVPPLPGILLKPIGRRVRKTLLPRKRKRIPLALLLPALINQPRGYRVYKGSGAGGAVDYTSVIATMPTLSYAATAVATPSDTTFAVRAYDPFSGLEDRNTDARVRLRVDAGGADISTQPNAPDATVSATATAAGTALVTWSYNPGKQGGAPTGFKVWLTAGASVNYAAAVAATVAYDSRSVVFTATLTGLADGTAYSVGVRAYNAVATETNVTAIASVTGEVTGPTAVDGASATASFTSPSATQP